MGETKRLLLEVLKCLHPAEVLLTASLVCKIWKAVTELDELWREFIEDRAETADRSERLLDIFRFDVYRPTFVPFLSNGSIFRLNLTSLELQPLAPASDVAFFPGARLLFLHTNDLLITGGWKSAQCHLLSNRTRELLPFPNMTVDKSGHGVVEVAGFVYCLGGYTEGKETAVILSTPIRNPNWIEKSPMCFSRAEISPCASGHSVYIAGGGVVDVEKYDTRTDTSELLPLRISQVSAATCIAFNFLLIILTPKERMIATLRDYERVSLSSSELWWLGHSDIAPFFHKGSYYMSVQTHASGKVYAYSLVKSKLQRYEYELV